MNCLPLEDLCRLHEAHVSIVVDAQKDFLADNRTFILGTFNGRKFTYAWSDKAAVITIEEEDRPLEILGE